MSADLDLLARRERVIELARLITECQEQLARHEAELQALINGYPTTGPGKWSPFTVEVFRELQGFRGHASVPALAERLGIDTNDQQGCKRIHNALRSLHRRGLAQRVERGRWLSCVAPRN